jgi:hypothetical protein
MQKKQKLEGNGFCTKVFWVFVFGHFFCPFLKRGFTFRQKVMPEIECEHNALVCIFSLKNLLA